MNKPGWQTSEHWSTLGSGAAFLYFASEAGSWQVQAVGLICAAAVTIAYAFSRATAKKVAL